MEPIVLPRAFGVDPHSYVSRCNFQTLPHQEKRVGLFIMACIHLNYVAIQSFNLQRVLQMRTVYASHDWEKSAHLQTTTKGTSITTVLFSIRLPD